MEKDFPFLELHWDIGCSVGEAIGFMRVVVHCYVTGNYVFLNVALKSHGFGSIKISEMLLFMVLYLKVYLRSLNTSELQKFV